MKPLNQLIASYTALLQQGDLQTAYRGIMDFMGALRGAFTSRFAGCEVGGLYQGFMDMSYFAVSTVALRQKGLKFAVVYLHPTGAFEIWLSGRNREITRQYRAVFNSTSLADMAAFHDATNEDAVVEATLTSAPDFDSPAALMALLGEGAEKFIAAVTRLA